MSIGTGFWDGRVGRVLGCEGGALDAQPVAFGCVDGWFDYWALGSASCWLRK